MHIINLKFLFIENAFFIKIFFLTTAKSNYLMKEQFLIKFYLSYLGSSIVTKI